MIARILILLVLTSVAGCANARLSKAQKDRIAMAKSMCDYVDINAKDHKITIRPIIEDVPVLEQAFAMDASKKSDAVIFGAVWKQTICTLQYINPAFNGDMKNAWENETSAAFGNWPLPTSGTYVEQLTALMKARTVHLEKITKDFSSVPATSMEFELFNAAIPKQDFLKIKEYEFHVRAGDKLTFKGVNLGKSEGNYCVTSQQFSNDIRPSLAEIRPAIGEFAFGLGGQKNVLKQVVGAIYDAGARRIQKASEITAGTATAKDSEGKPCVAPKIIATALVTPASANPTPPAPPTSPVTADAGPTVPAAPTVTSASTPTVAPPVVPSIAPVTTVVPAAPTSPGTAPPAPAADTAPRQTH